MKRTDIWNTIQSEFKEESLGTIIKVAKELAKSWAKKKLNDILKNA